MSTICTDENESLKLSQCDRVDLHFNFVRRATSAIYDDWVLLSLCVKHAEHVCGSDYNLPKMGANRKVSLLCFTLESALHPLAIAVRYFALNHEAPSEECHVWLLLSLVRPTGL